MGMVRGGDIMYNTNNIKGFNKIILNREMFLGFLQNFTDGIGLEAKESFEPLSVKFIKERGRKYLRFDYMMYGKREWLHVLGTKSWF